MKNLTLYLKRMIALVIMAAGSTYLHAQAETTRKKNSVDESGVPVKVVERFKADHPGVSANWLKKGRGFAAEFIEPGTNRGRVRGYTQNGGVAWREDEMDNYPPPISAYLDKNYPGEGLLVWSRVDSTGNSTYYANRGGEKIYFNAEGKFIGPVKTRKSSKKTMIIGGSSEGR